MKELTEEAADTDANSAHNSSVASSPTKPDSGNKISKKIRAEQVNEIYNQAHVSQLATLAVIAMIPMALWNHVSHIPLIGWVCFAVIGVFYRSILSFRYSKRSPQDSNIPFWEKLFLVGVTLSAVAWASLTLLMMQLSSILHIGFLGFVIVGMATAAVATLVAIVNFYRIYAITLITPTIIFLFFQLQDTGSLLATMLTIYLLVLLRTTRIINQNYIRSLQSRFDNVELVNALSTSKEQAEKLNKYMEGEIIDRKHAEEALFREKEQAFVTLESIGDGVITTDNFGFIKYMNPFAEKLTGWVLGEAEGAHLNKVFHLINEDTREPVSKVYDCMMNPDVNNHLPTDVLLIPRASKVEFAIEIESEYAIEITATPIKDRKNKIIGAVLVFHDVTEMKGMARQMSYHASHDSLTGLVNRREFENQIERSLHSARQENINHALMYLDLDQFKIVNDTCGHLAGDELLKQISMLLQSKIRSVDTLARLGGDEFGVLLLGCGLDNAQKIADQLLQAIKEYRFAWQERNFDIGTSIGVAPITGDTVDKSEILSAADSACYVAKDQGRNRIHVYLPNDESIAFRKGELMWVQKVKQALATDSLCLYYQPVVPVSNHQKKKVYCEFLLGLQDKNGEIIPPMAFIPAAERYHMMSSVDRWVVQTVMNTVAKKDSAINQYDICAINLSGQSICDDDFLDFILIQLAEHNIDPGKICFEITETAAIANFQQATNFISKLHRMGCCFALDDFGSGLSSFAYLKKLDVDFLKIDGSFVKDISKDPVNYAMVQAINQLGHAMGKKTIAEFVEQKSILPKLRRLGVDYAQGYAIEKPKLLDIEISDQSLKMFKAN